MFSSSNSILEHIFTGKTKTYYQKSGFWRWCWIGIWVCLSNFEYGHVGHTLSKQVQKLTTYSLEAIFREAKWIVTANVLTEVIWPEKHESSTAHGSTLPRRVTSESSRKKFRQFHRSSSSRVFSSLAPHYLTDCLRNFRKTTFHLYLPISSLNFRKIPIF